MNLESWSREKQGSNPPPHPRRLSDGSVLLTAACIWKTLNSLILYVDPLCSLRFIINYQLMVKNVLNQNEEEIINDEERDLK